MSPMNSAIARARSLSARVQSAFRKRNQVPSDYRRLYRMSGRDWILALHEELAEREAHWMGVRALKNPLDAWIYQEIIYEVRPAVIVELGGAFGGSALFLCHMMDLLNLDAQLISVDHQHSEFVADHPRIVKVTGDTRDPAVVQRTHELSAGRRGLVIHDASHVAEVVLEDLSNYSDLVAPGSYLIVEDGVRDFIAGKPGPVMAVNEFMKAHPEFELDPTRERFGLTYNPRGFLRRLPDETG